MKTLSFFFALTFCLSYGYAQDLRFSYTITDNGTSTSIAISVSNLGSSPENMAGYSMNIYYDNTESSLTNYDLSPTATIGWTNSQSATNHVANVNPVIPVGHTGYANINVIDENLLGTNFNANSVLILTINFDNTIGTAAASDFYLASTAQNHPALNYVGSDFIGHPVIINQNVSFPVEWADFSAKALPNRRAQLSWMTHSELNNQGFVIERADAQNGDLDWQSIGYVAGMGTTNQLSEYRFVDEQAQIGENLYRLKQIDIDGHQSLSEIRSLYFEASPTVIIYPNPSADLVNIKFGTPSNENHARFELYDIAGRKLASGQLKMNETGQISLATYAEGSYLLRIQHNGIVSEKQVVKRD